MMKPRLQVWLCVCMLLVVAAVAEAKRFQYHSFADREFLSLVGGVSRAGKCLTFPQQTGRGQGDMSSGAFWYERPISLASGFSTTFHFSVQPSPGVAAFLNNDSFAHGLDGFAFVLQGVGPTALGGADAVSGIGYDGLENGFVVEFDMAKSEDEMDPNANHVSIHSAMQSPLSAYEAEQGALYIPEISLQSPKKHTVQITYDGHTVSFYINNLVKPKLKVRVGKFTGDHFYVGFTSASLRSSRPIARNNTGHIHICDWYTDGRGGDTEPCDDGFIGSNCILDTRPSLHECLQRSSCNQCVSSARDCRWCGSKQRCVAGVTLDAKDSEYCPDVTEAMDYEGCLAQKQSLIWVWTFFIVLLAVTVFVSLVGKVMLVPSSRDQQFVWELSSLLFSTGCGALYAIAVSFAVNAILVEISVSPFFATVFGLLFIFIGGLIFFQTMSHHFLGNFGEFRGTTSHFTLLTVFSLQICVTGVICFVLEKDWTHALSVSAKVPLYALLGIALCYSLVFCSVDLLHRLMHIGEASPDAHKPLVDSVLRVRLLSATAILSGLYFGWVFGMLDVEDVNRSHIELSLQEDNAYCYPIGCLLGGLSSFLAHFLDNPESTLAALSPLASASADDETSLLIDREAGSDIIRKRHN